MIVFAQLQDPKLNNVLKISYKIKLNKRQDIMPPKTPRQMIISYCDVKNILFKNNLK